MNYYIEREKTPEGRRQQYVDFVVHKMKASESRTWGVRQRLPRLYDLFRGVYTGRFHPHKNNVHLPLIFAAIWADAAHKAATSLSTMPYLRFMGYGPDDQPIARKRESLVSAQLSDINIFQKMIDLYLKADLYGVAITQVGWTRKEQMRMIEEIQRAPLSDRVIRSVRKGKIITFDGPDLQDIDRLDFFGDEAKSISLMKGYVRRYTRDIDDVRALVEQGIFDKGELNRMEYEGGVNANIAQEQALISRYHPYMETTTQDAQRQDKYDRPVELLEYWGEIPSELAPDGVYCRVLTIANRRYLMRNRPTPYWHGMLPAIEFSPTPDPHYFDAPGKAEVAEKLQLTANRYVNQQLDAADFQLEPMWWMDRAANFTGKLLAKPGALFKVDGDPNKVVASLHGNFSNLAAAEQQVNMASRFLQMAMGIYDDATIGAQGDSRQTAREFLGRREAAGTRLNLESMLFEKGYFEPLGNMIVALDKQFLELPVEVLILGDNAYLDDVTKQPINASREVLDGYDMTPNYAARAMGSLTALHNSGMMQDKIIQLAQMAGSDPTMVGAVNKLIFWRGIFKTLGVPNINEIFQRPDFQTMINQATGGGAGAPQAGGLQGPAQAALMGIPTMPGTPQPDFGNSGSGVPPLAQFASGQ